MTTSAVGGHGLGRGGDPDERLSLRVRELIRYEFRVPSRWLPALAFNSAFVVVMWIWMQPETAFDHRAVVLLPLAFASWVFAGAFLTNLFGDAPDRWRLSLHDGKAIRSEITARNLAFWILVAPACAVMCLIIAPAEHEFMLGFAVLLLVLFVPLGYLGTTSLLAPLVPYHRLSVRDRIRRRDTWPRYGLAMFLPFLLTIPAAFLADLPVEIAMMMFGMDDTAMVVAAILTVPWAVFMWQGLIYVSCVIAERRQVELGEFLADPTR